MRPRHLFLALGVMLALVGCASSKAGPTTTSGATTTATTTIASTTTSPTTAPATSVPATTVVPGTTSVTTGASTTAGPASTTTAPRAIDDPAYVKLAVDCVYKGDKNGSCQKLVAAGYPAEGNYGLGNSLTQAPNGPLRTDCLAGQQLSCAELDARVDAAIASGDKKPLLCLAYHNGAPEPADVVRLRPLLGNDAPSGVRGSLDVLETTPDDPDALGALRGYIGPICA